MKLNPEIIDYIRDRFDELWKQKGYTRVIIDEVKEKFETVINKDHIRYYCILKIDEMREQIDAVNDGVDDEKLYEFVDDTYYIGDFKFSRELMNRIFKAYSVYGQNKTKAQMLTDFTIKPEAWNAIVRALGLQKWSHAFCPETMKMKTEEEMDVMIEEVVAESHDAIKAKMIVTNKKLEEKELKQYRKILGNIDYFLDHLKKSLVGIDWDYEPKRYIQPNNNNVGRYFVTDVHFGKEGTDDMINRLYSIRDEILCMPEWQVIIHNLGDLMESMIQGGFHFWHVEEMDVKPQDQLLLATKTFRDIFLSLYEAGKDVEFHTIGWNHDRIGKNHDEDIMRTGNYWFGSMLEMLLEKTNVKIHLYTNLISCYQSDNVNYVMIHRDQGLDKKKPDEIILAGMQDGSIDPKKYTVILWGHTHAAEFRESTLCKYVVVPTLAGQDSYSRFKIVKHSVPGYVRIKENNFGSVDVEFKSLW